MAYQANTDTIMKKIYSGFESSGKSLMLAEESKLLVERNAKLAKTGLKVRPLLSNMPYTPTFEVYAKALGVPIVYWKSLDQIKDYIEADIICDEVGKFFDSRFWEKLSLDIRTWLSEGAKQGIHWYGGAQDFAQVDKSFRRLVQKGDLIHVTKIIGNRRPSATFPPVKYIWGVMLLQSLDPQGYNEDKKKFEGGGLPKFRFIRREFCEIFYTNKKIQVDTHISLRHVLAKCADPNCTYQKIAHV